MAALLHHLGARIVALVHAVAEAHQAEGVVLVLGLGHVSVDVPLVADFRQHVQHRLVGAAVGGPPQGRNAGGDAGEGVGAGGAGQAHRGGGGVLLMVRVQQEDAVQGPGDHRVDLILLARGGEHHVQEVLRIAEVVARIDEGLAPSVLVGHRRQGGQLGDQPVRRPQPMLRIVDVQGVVVEGGKRRHHAAKHGHGMGVPPVALDQGLHLLMDHGVAADVVDELIPLRRIRQFAVQQQVADLQEVGLVGQLLDGIAPVQQHPGVPVNVGEFGDAGGGGDEAGIVGEVAVPGQAADVDHVRAAAAGAHRKFDFVAVYAEPGNP